MVHKTEKQKDISEDAFDYASIKTREDADEFLKKQVSDKDLRECFLNACDDNFDTFNPKMAKLFSCALKKQNLTPVLNELRAMHCALIQSDQTFCEPAIEAGIKLLETDKFSVSDIRSLFDSMRDRENFNLEELAHLHKEIPNNVKHSSANHFVFNRSCISKNAKGEFKKEAFDLYNKLYSKLNDPMTRASVAHSICIIVSNCYVNGEIDKKLSETLLKACKDKFNSRDIEKIIKLVNKHLQTNQNEIDENGIKFFVNLKDQGLSIDQCKEILDSLKNPDGIHSIEAFNGFQKLKKEMNLPPEQALSTIDNCKDNKGFFQKGLYDYAEKNIRIFTNLGKYEPEIEDMQKLYLQIQFAKNNDKTNIDDNKKKIVDDVISNYGYSFSDRNDILYALGKKHFESNFEQFKKLYSEETNSEMSARNKLLMGLNQDKKFDPQLYEQMQNLKKEMLNRKTELRYGNDDLSDYEIEKSFDDNVKNIKKTVELLGQKVTIYLFKYKLDGFEDYVSKIAELIDRLKKANPQRKEAFLHLISPLTTNADMQRANQILKLKQEIKNTKTPEQAKKETINDAKIKQSEKEITELKKQINISSDKNEETKIKSLIKAKTQEINALKAENKKMIGSPEKLREIDKIQGERLEFSKAEITDYQNKIDAINIISSINIDSDDFYLLYPYLDPKTKEEKQILKTQLSKLVFNFLNVEYDDKTAKPLNLSSSKYLKSLFGANETFKESFADLVYIIKDSDCLNVSDALNELECNLETKKQFEANGINYEKWVNADKSSYLNVTVETDIEKAKQNAIKNLESDLNDPLFELIPQKQVKNIFTALENAKIKVKENDEMTYVENGIADKAVKVKRLYFEGKPLKFENLDKALNAIKEEFNKNEFWSKELDDEKIANARDTIYTHIIKMRIPEAGVAKSLKASESVNLEVHKTDMNDISHALFLGNHANCCTAVENINGWSAPKYIKHKLISGIEIMDKNDFVGNTMCYFAKVDGELALVLDNIELKTKYQYNDKIKNTLIDYAKKLAEEVGKPDIPIYSDPTGTKLTYPSFR